MARFGRRSLVGWALFGTAAVLSAAFGPGEDRPPQPVLRERISADARTGSTSGAEGDLLHGRVWSGPAPAATTVPSRDVLSLLRDDAPLPAPEVLGPMLGDLAGHPSLGQAVGYDVRDALTGRQLAGRSEREPRAAASTTKLLTGAAVLSLLGPDTTLPTRVVAGATVDEVVLVGGGDVLLARGRGSRDSVNGRAGLADLAARTAAALRAAGRTTVAVRLDDSAFTGPSLPQGTDAADVSAGFIAPVMAVAVDCGRVRQGQNGPRSPDPALAAARAFVRLLEARGIEVTGGIARARAPEEPSVLAQVSSAPIGELVEYMLTHSDNTVAEALARLVAVHSDRPATFADAGVAIMDRIDMLGVPTGGVTLIGGSGLGRRNVIPPATLTALLALAADPDHPELRTLLSGLPVAAASGTLTDRFTSQRSRAGAGVVRAKTGTLTGVSSLAGTVVDADGRLLVFALVADHVPSTSGAKSAGDAFAAALAGCGCR